MQTIRFYTFIRKQIPVMNVLSLIPGIAYLIFGYVNNIFYPALFWYTALVFVSIYGHYLYKSFNEDKMSKQEKNRWYFHTRLFFYAIFSMWTVIFILYVPYRETNIHYIAVFTQIGASVVAATLLFPDKKIFTPILLVLILPLTVYFSMGGELYTYVLTLFSLVLLFVLFYSAYSSNTLILTTKTQASLDMLTKLYNRQHSVTLLQESINTLKQDGDTSFILLIDLDHFKNINDTLGHDIGDLLLQEVAYRMKLTIRQAHVARLGGDEFIIISHNSYKKKEAMSVSRDIANELLIVLKEIYIIEEHQLYISASIGISLINDISRPANDYIKEADIAMYEVKHSGKDNVFIFDDKMSQKVQRSLELEHLIPSALQNNEFSLEFQPQMSIEGLIVGCEVLTRWNNIKYGSVSPAEFIPLAEQSIHMLKLGYFILEESFQHLSSWDKQGIKLQQFSINLSMKQIYDPNFTKELLKLSKRYLNKNLQQCITLEITESIEPGNLEYLIGTMNTLKEHGFKFALDDFGTGYSSLSYLRSMPIDELKIDRSFIMELEHSDKDNTMVDTILTMAERFNYRVVAEGVEEQFQLTYLKERNCHIIQGYLFSKPLNEELFIAYYYKHIA